MKLITRIWALTAAGLLAVTGVGAGAAPILWSFSGVTFNDGGVASGTFDYDASINQFSTFSVMTSGGSALSPKTYDNSNTSLAGSSATSLFFLLNDSSRYLVIKTASPLTNSGGTIPIIAGPTSLECTNCGLFRTVTAGSFVGATSGASVPEPATWAMLIIGFGFIGAALRRRPEANIAFAG